MCKCILVYLGILFRRLEWDLNEGVSSLENNDSGFKSGLGVLQVTCHKMITTALQHILTRVDWHSVPITTRGAITVTSNSDKQSCAVIVRTSELSPCHPSKPCFRVATVR